MDATAHRQPGRVEVVGYDGSAASRAALRLAVRRAGPDGEVVVVHAARPQPDPATAPYAALGAGFAPKVPVDDEHRDRVREHGEGVLAALPADVFGAVAHRGVFVEASPADAIADVAAAENADEIVIGSRGGGSLRWLLGSVSHALLQIAGRPLVVVPTDAVSHASGAGGDGPEVAVVGFDGSADALGALRHVKARLAPGSTIIAACAVKEPPDWQGAVYADRAVELETAHARQALDMLDAEDMGALTLEREIVSGSPAVALAKLAHDRGAQEIAVGSRGLGRVRAALGSVSHALVHEADRPVVVVPGAG